MRDCPSKKIIDIYSGGTFHLKFVQNCILGSQTIGISSPITLIVPVYVVGKTTTYCNINVFIN